MRARKDLHFKLSRCQGEMYDNKMSGYDNQDKDTIFVYQC